MASWFSAPPADILQAIQAVAAGMSVFGPELTARIAGDDRAPSTVFPELTPREHDILTLLGDRHSNVRIARDLNLSEETVRNNVSVILAELRVDDRTAAGDRARAAGLRRPTEM